MTNSVWLKKIKKGQIKNYSFPFIFSLLTCTGLQAQKNTDTLMNRQTNGESNAVAFGLYLPLGVFTQSHIVGAGIDYSWSRHRYSRNISPAKLIGFTVNGGINYYVGKKITTAGYGSHYGGYINLYAMPGLQFNPVKNGNISLTTGPSLDIYKASANAGIGINLLGNYFVSKNIAIGPGIIYKKHTNTDALWSATIRASYTF